MILRLTREQRKVKRLIDILWKEGVRDEGKAVAFYRKIAEKFRELGYSEEAEILEFIMKTEQTHKDILNDMILNLRSKVIWKEWLKEGGV